MSKTRTTTQMRMRFFQIFNFTIKTELKLKDWDKTETYNV